MMIPTIEGTQGAIDGKVAIVVSRYNQSVTKKLLDGAVATLKTCLSESQIQVIWVPGAWELPLVVKACTDQTDIVGAIALGVVIRGETSHDQHINRSVSHALMKIGVQSGKPIGFGLLTVYSLDQALNRAGGNVGNKGEECAQAVLEMLGVLHRLRTPNA